MLRKKRASKRKLKAFAIIYKGLSLKQTKGECPTLISLSNRLLLEFIHTAEVHLKVDVN